MRRKFLLIVSVLTILAGCKVGPDYQRPAVESPVDWRWKKAVLIDAAPHSDGGLPSSPWQVFNDATLDQLESLALDANQDIKAAVGRIDEARALARVSRADFYPQLSAQPVFSRSNQSATTFFPGAPGGGIKGIRNPSNFFSMPLDFSYEADVWGRVRRSISASRERAEASVADYHTVILTVTSDVASNYFLLRALDADIDVLQHTLGLRGESLKLVNNQFKFGVADALDTNRARTDVATTEASLADAKRQREEIAHVLAVLCGKPASVFTIDFKPLACEPPEVPAGLPSALLERRPDVVRAERLLAASSEDIGVAVSNYFPRFALTASGGFESAEMSKLFDAHSAIFNVATNIIQPVFTGGRNRAQLEAANARYTEAESTYRQQVLVAFKDVEDALLDIRMRGEQAKALADAIAAAREVTRLSTTRYQNGQVSYFDVVDAQRIELGVEQQSTLVRGERMTAAVRLIKALGGGWNCSCQYPLNTAPPAVIPIEPAVISETPLAAPAAPAPIITPPEVPPSPLPKDQGKPDAPAPKQ